MARHFLERIYLTEDEEIDCGGMMDIIGRYVELQVHGADAAAALPEAYLHLEICEDCAEVAAVLTEMVRLEEVGELPRVDELWVELEAVVGCGDTDAIS